MNSQIIEVCAASTLVFAATIWALWWVDYRALRGYLWALAGSVTVNTALWIALGNVGIMPLLTYCLTAVLILSMVVRVTSEASDEMPPHLYHIAAVASFLWVVLCGLWILPDLREGWGYVQLQLGIVLIEAMLLTASGMVLLAAWKYAERPWLRTLGFTWTWQGLGKFVALAGLAGQPSGNWPYWSSLISTAIVTVGLFKLGLDISLARRLRMLEQIT